MKKKIIVVLSVIILILAIILTMKILKSTNTNIKNGNNENIDNIDNIQEEILLNSISTDKDNLLKQIELNKTNCQYCLNGSGGKVIIQKYEGIEDIIIVPQTIDGCEVEQIEKEAFLNCYNLEKILVSENIANNIGELQDFKVSEKQNTDGYKEYITTREYGETYKEYINLPKEEKESQEIIPYKFDVPLERAYSSEMKEQYDSDEEIPAKFDLQNQIDIEVENQRSFGTCYAYASLNTIETNLALRKSEYVDLSEIHYAIMTGYRLWRFFFNC